MLLVYGHANGSISLEHQPEGAENEMLRAVCQPKERERNGRMADTE